MSPKDFGRWWSDYSTRFPDTGEWVRKQPKAEDLLAVWQEALASVDLADALDINRQLTRGEVEHWPAYEREETPAKIRRLCWDLRRTRGEDQERYERPANAEHSKFPIGILFRQLVACNERHAKNPDFDKQAEHKRLQGEFLAKYSAKPARNAALDSYSPA